jgi:hypothetical protein
MAIIAGSSLQGAHLASLARAILPYHGALLPTL